MKGRMENELTQERRDCLFWLWYEETEDLETQEWREDLTPAEEAYVASLDRGFASGCLQLSTSILVLESICRDFPLHQVREVSRRGSHCRLELTDGQVFDCWLDEERKIHYTEEESQA